MLSPASPAKTCCPRAQAAPTQGCTRWARWHRLHWRRLSPRPILPARSTAFCRPLSACSAPPGSQAISTRGTARGQKPTNIGSFAEKICPPWQARYVYALNTPLNVDAMQRCRRQGFGRARLHLLCRQRFRCRAAMCAASMLRSGCKNPSLLLYRVRGNGFLHHMVRNLVGTFLEVGRGNLAETEIPAILASRSREEAGPTAPARGLFLVNVDYLQSLTAREDATLRIWYARRHRPLSFFPHRPTGFAAARSCGLPVVPLA